MPSCSRVVDAAPHKAIVLPVKGNNLELQLREQDISWENFLSNVSNQARYVMHNKTILLDIFRKAF